MAKQVPLGEEGQSIGLLQSLQTGGGIFDCVAKNLPCFAQRLGIVKPHLAPSSINLGTIRVEGASRMSFVLGLKASPQTAIRRSRKATCSSPDKSPSPGPPGLVQVGGDRLALLKGSFQIFDQVATEETNHLVDKQVRLKMVHAVDLSDQARSVTDTPPQANEPPHILGKTRAP